MFQSNKEKPTGATSAATGAATGTLTLAAALAVALAVAKAKKAAAAVKANKVGSGMTIGVAHGEKVIEKVETVNWQNTSRSHLPNLSFKFVSDSIKSPLSSTCRQYQDHKSD